MQQLPLTLLSVLIGVANSFLPLTSPTRAASIPNLTFRPYVHVHSQGGGITGYSPAQIKHAYGFDQISSQGAGHSIAIVDAYNDTHLGSDLQTFINTYHLPQLNGLPGKTACSIKVGPHPCFQVINQATKSDADWSTETALDSEWSHAIAGQADVLVVEAKDGTAKSFASALTTTMSYSPSVVSLSWGGPEFARESDWDSTLNQSMVVAASGDQGYGPSFPATSPDALAVGGTTLTLDANGNRVGAETAWAGSGGGMSTYQNRPIWQAKNLLGVAFTLRLTPDVSYNADPGTGYSIYNNGWEQVGGTSAATPQWAAMLTLSNQVPRNAAIYKLGTATNRGNYFTDITTGTNGSCKVLCETRPGYDSVTGLGSPLAKSLVPAL